MKSNPNQFSTPSADTNPRYRVLRTALLGNAGFSTISGILMLFFPALVGDWLGVQAQLIFQLIGGGLLFFAADLIHQSTRPRMASWRGLYSSIADFGWVVGTVILLVAFPGVLSSQGVMIASAVALIVLAFGVWQLVGVDRLHRSMGSGLYRHCVLVGVNASADNMWQSIAQLGEISRYMPTLKASKIRDEESPGRGCVRECEDQSGKRWAERCSVFDPDTRRFDVEFLCDEPGFPFPASEMLGGWQVMPDGASSCVVMVWWELQPKPRWLAPVLLPLLGFQADRDFPRVIHIMATEAGEQPVSQTRSRLVPRFC
jgi:hypothetical protein